MAGITHLCVDRADMETAMANAYRTMTPGDLYINLCVLKGALYTLAEAIKRGAGKASIAPMIADTRACVAVLLKVAAERGIELPGAEVEIPAPSRRTH